MTYPWRGPTVTLHKVDNDPAIIGLKALGCRTPVVLARFRAAFIRLGRSPDNHICVSDRHVSRLQCFLHRRGFTWMVTPYRDAKNPTCVNGVIVTGETPLYVGSFLSCGRSVWLCVDGADRSGEWRIAAAHQQRFLQTALLAYGSGYAGGNGIGLHPNTFRRRLHADEQGADIVALCARARRSPFGYPVLGGTIKPGVCLEPGDFYAAYESQ